MTEQDMTQQQQPAFFTSWSQMEQIARNRPVELIKGFVPTGGVMVLAGAPGTGKSFTALSWAAAIAEGSSWFGQQTRQAPVLYVLGEGFSGFGSRLEAWVSVNGGRKPNNLHFIDGLTHGIDLKDPGVVQQLINAFAYTQPGLVIFDTFSMLARVRSENDNAEVAQVMANVNKIVQATGATAMLIHHTTKTTGTVRGATAFVGNADTVVVATEDTKKNDNGTFLLSTEAQHGGKQRDGEARTLHGFKIDSPGILSRDNNSSKSSNSSTMYRDPNVEEVKQQALATVMAANKRLEEQEKGNK